MAVLKDWRGRGVGEALLATLIDQARALGYVPLPDALVQQVQTYWSTNLNY